MGELLYQAENEISASGAMVQMRRSVWEQVTEQEVIMTADTLATKVSGFGVWVKPTCSSQRRRYFKKLGNIYYLPKGSSLIVRPNSLGTNRHLACVFSGETVDRTGLATVASRHPINGYDVNSTTLRTLFGLMLKEYHTPGFANQLFVDSLAMALGVELARALHGHSSDDLPKGGLGEHQLRKIRERIIEVESMPTINELAELCKISERHLIRTFKRATGMTVFQYVEHVRLEKSKQLLGTDLPIKEVAARLGFRNSSNFSAAFKRMTSMTPTMFRRIGG